MTVFVSCLILARSDKARSALCKVPFRMTASPSYNMSEFNTGVPQAWFQKTITLKARARGCHLITSEVLGNLPELRNYNVGLCNIFIQHTSASLTINENASPDVPNDMESSLNRIVPEDPALYTHLDEGLDDMPAHVKTSLMGFSLMIPVTRGRLALGTWQGIWLNEHRDHGGSRRIVVTIQGA